MYALQAKSNYNDVWQWSRKPLLVEFIKNSKILYCFTKNMTSWHSTIILQHKRQETGRALCFHCWNYGYIFIYKRAQLIFQIWYTYMDGCVVGWMCVYGCRTFGSKLFKSCRVGEKWIGMEIDHVVFKCIYEMKRVSEYIYIFSTNFLCYNDHPD